MKKINRRSVFCLVLVLIQVFFVFSLTAIAADETSEGVVLSLSKTSLEQDLTAEVVAEKDEMYIEGQKAVSLVAFSAEKASATTFDLFFYLFSPRGFADLTSVKLTLAENLSDTSTRVVMGDILDRSKTLIKLRVSGAARKLCGYDSTTGTLNLKLANYMFSYGGTSMTYPASYSDFIGSESNGFYTFSYDLTSGILQSSNQIDTLEMRVTLAAERFWKSEHTYTQVNTAMMLLPDSFFLRYGEIEWIEYMYTLYEKVPMLVTTSKDLYQSIQNGKRFPLGNSKNVLDPALPKDAFDPISLNYARLDKYFAFLVDSIAQDEDIIERDVGLSEILKRFYLAKDFYGEAFGIYIYAESVSEKQPMRVSKEEIFEKEHSEPKPNIWDRIFGGGFFDSYEDNSFLLEKIHVVESVDLSLSDDQLSDLYAIDESYVPSFRSLALECKKGYRLVMMRYLTTDYCVEDFTYFRKDSDSSYVIGTWAEGYYCLNSIVEDFQILKIQFAKENAVGNVVRTTIIPDNPEQDFVDPPESDGKGEDEAKITPDEWWQEFLDKFKRIGEILRKILIAILITLGVFLILRLIARIRDAFGRRYPREDKPPRERRRRK